MKLFLRFAFPVLLLVVVATGCETMNSSSRTEPGGDASLAREAENWKVKRISPEDLLKGAVWAGDSLTHTAERELKDDGLPVDSFRLKNLPLTAGVASTLGATVAIVPMSRPGAGVRVSRPTPETFSYVRPAGSGKVWRVYFTRKGVAEFYTQRMRPLTRAEKRAAQ
jgi:hypothetical protein